MSSLKILGADVQYEKPRKAATSKGPVEKRRDEPQGPPVIKPLEIPRVVLSDTDGKTGLQLVAEKIKKQREAEDVARAGQLKSIHRFVDEWMNVSLKFIHDAERAMSVMDKRDAEAFLSSELPGREEVTIGQQIKEYEDEIRKAQSNPDSTISLYLTVAEEVFWISSKDFSRQKMSEKLELLVKKDILCRNNAGAIVGTDRKRFSLAQRFDDLQEIVKAELEGLVKTAIENQVNRIKEESKEEAKERVSNVVAQGNQEGQEASSGLNQERQGASLDDVFFGGMEDEFVLPWKFYGTENVIKGRRVDVDGEERLYITDVVVGDIRGMEELMDELVALKSHLGDGLDWSEEDGPYVLLRHIIAKDGEHLCPTKGGEKDRYLFNGRVDIGLQMTRWIRTALSYCLPKRLLPEDREKMATQGAKKRPVKPAGQLMTSQEFYSGWMGSYLLKVRRGFYYDHKNEVGETSRFEVLQDATVHLSRKMKGDNGFVIYLEKTSSDEVAQILGISGAEVNWDWADSGDGIPTFLEFPDTKKWPEAPKAVQFMLGQDFKFFKEGEPEQ